MRRLTIVLEACGGAPATIEHEVPPTPFDGELPALYADLFVDGGSGFEGTTQTYFGKASRD